VRDRVLAGELKVHYVVGNYDRLLLAAPAARKAVARALTGTDDLELHREIEFPDHGVLAYHGNIVSVFDQVTEGDETYLIMEFVDGRTLDDILQGCKIFPWIEAAAMIDDICAGLAYAYARAVIHRDIKPANIFVGKDRSVKLGDFGLARVVREMSIRQTEIRGTPLYMAPEQIVGRDIDARADLYAVGCTFFELVCGRPPFIDGEILYA